MNPPVDTQTKSGSKLMKNVLFVCIFLLIFLTCGITATIGFFYHTYIYRFEQNAGVKLPELFKIVKNGLETPVKETSNKKNILILGTDQVSNRVSEAVLTDTIILLSIDLKSGLVHSVSLPRDIWSQEYQTKINALYFYGGERNPGEPEAFVSQVLSELSGVPIHNTFVVSLDTLSQLIDTLGGVEVQVEQGFRDELFPRSDVNLGSESDPDKLYQTVEFFAGRQKMSAEQALQYIRSRNSIDPEQGNDESRVKRQQQVLSAVLQTLNSPNTYQDPTKMGKLFAFYQVNFSEQLSFEELVAVVNNLRSGVFSIKFDPQSISIDNGTDSGVLTHPPVSKYQQWVYEIKDREAFQQEVRALLKHEQI